jgi:hypothetical protein
MINNKPMKNLLFVLMSFFVFVCNAQEEDQNNHCIFFILSGDYHLRKISESDYCIIGLRQTNKRYEGDIRKILNDNISINDTILKIRDIAYFSFRDELKGPVLLSKPSDLPSEFVLYPKDTLISKPIIPPVSIFSSGWDYKMYVNHLKDSASRAEKHQMMEHMFKEKRKPGRK